jgi:predicted nucleic acid-binding protein
MNGTEVPWTTDISKDKIVFDTSWVINFLKDNVDGQMFEGAGRYVSVITRIELYGFPGITPKEQADISRFLKDVTVIPLIDDVEQRTVEVRRRFRLKTPDAIIAATALALGASLVTGDGSLTRKNIPGLPIIAMPSPPTGASWQTTFRRNKSPWITLACFIASTLLFAILFILK